MKSIVFALLFCALLSFAVADTERVKSKNIILDVNRRASSYNTIALEVENAGAATSAVSIKDAQAKSWSSMTYSSSQGYWTYKFSKRINFPLSFELTSASGETIVVSNVIRSLDSDKIDTGRQFGSSSTVTSSPVTTTKAPATTTTKAASTTAKATAKPTAKPTTAATAKPTVAATAKPTKAPTTAPVTTTKAPTTTKAATTTIKATAKPTSSSGSGCSAGIKLMVPLYTYPGSTWEPVIANAKLVKTVAIINPNSGPGTGPDSTFKTYTKKMADAGVEMIGYVHTSYGSRSISEVKKEIDIYASEFQYVTGIFLDEVSATQDKLSYYQQLYEYIMSMPGFKYDVINPGAVPVAGYANAATQIVSFENTASAFSSSSNPGYATCANKDKFVAISYGASSASSMQSFLNTAKTKGYYGWAYVNDGSASGATYNRIPSYYAAQAAYMATL